MEQGLRTISVGVLAWMLWLSLVDKGGDTETSVRSGTLTAFLGDISTRTLPPARISVALDSAPAPMQRDWLAALEASGSNVTWWGNIPATAVSTTPVVSPRGGILVAVAAPAEAAVILSDAAGPIVTVKAEDGGARMAVAAASGAITARVAGANAQTVQRDSVAVRRLLVIGSAGWESKFVVAALEEDGWKVDARIRVAPGIEVSQGQSAVVDTSRYSAVIALDETAAAYASQTAAFVRKGGGLILAGKAASHDAFVALRPGRAGNAVSAAIPAGSLEPGATTLRSLTLAAVANIRSDVTVLDRRGRAVAIAARRHGAGRVLQHGYGESWRWRMTGGETSVNDHRRWWSSAVSSVAYAPRTRSQSVPALDDAPLARLTAALGPPSSADAASLAKDAGPLPLWSLFALLSISLLGEWASRRLRGAR